MHNSANWNQSMKWHLLQAWDDTRCSRGVIWKGMSETPKAGHALSTLMWNSQIFPPRRGESSSQKLQVSNWEPNVFPFVPVSYNLYSYNTNCSEETADGILRFFRCFRTSILVAWPPFQTCALQAIWITLGIAWRMKKWYWKSLIHSEPFWKFSY